MLPLEFEVFNQFKKLKEEDINCENKVIAENIAVQLIDLWKNKGNLPTEGLYSVQMKVEVLYKRGRNILKIPRERREKMFDREEEEGIKRGRKNTIKLETFEKLFDICTCKHMSREDCDCPASKKVHEREFPFIIDQRTERKMVISGVDEPVTKAWENTRKKKESAEKFVEKEWSRQEFVREEIERKKGQFDEAEIDENKTIDEEFIPPSYLETKETDQNRIDIPKFVAELDRYHVSDGAGAAIATALMEDIGLVGDENNKLVFDKYKI